MTECNRIGEAAAGLAALPADDPERAAAWAHARTCADCARALRQAERLQILLAGVKPAPLPPGALARASHAILSDLRREARRRAAGSVVAAGAAFLALVALARHRSRSTEDWALASVLAVAAAGLAAWASRWTWLAVSAAVAAGLCAAGIAGGPGLLDSALGLKCVATEMASAAAVVGAVWLAVRGGTTLPARSAVAAAAAAGALAGTAALQITCEAHTALPHLLAFHVGGVILAAAGAHLAWRTGRRVAA